MYNWINAGPNIDEYKKVWSLYNEGTPAGNQIKSYTGRWRRDHLHPIIPYLSEDWKQTYGQLVGDFGPWDDEGTSHERAGYWTGSSSPATTEELERMTLDDLFSYLRTWVPSGGYFEASRSGLGNALGALVRKSQRNSPTKRRQVIAP